MGLGAKLSAGLQNATKSKRWDAPGTRFGHADSRDEGVEEERREEQEEEDEDDEWGRYAETIRPEDSISTINVDRRRGDYHDGLGEEAMYPGMGARAGLYGRGMSRTPLPSGGGFNNMYPSSRDPYGPRFPRSAEFDSFEDDYMMDRGVTRDHDIGGDYGLDDYDRFGVDSGIGGGFDTSTPFSRRPMDSSYPSNQFHSDTHFSDLHPHSNLISEEELMGSRFPRGPLLPHDSVANQSYYHPHFSRPMFSNPSLGGSYFSDSNRPRGRSLGPQPGATIPLSKQRNLVGKKIVAELGRVIISTAQIGVPGGSDSEPLLMQEMRKRALHKGADGVVDIRLVRGRTGDLIMDGLLVQTTSTMTPSLSGSMSQPRSVQSQRFGRNDFGPTTRPPHVRSGSYDSYGMRSGGLGESRRMGLSEDIDFGMRDRLGFGGTGVGRPLGGRSGYY